MKDPLYLSISAASFVISTLSILVPRTWHLPIPRRWSQMIGLQAATMPLHFDLEHVPITLVALGLLIGSVTLQDVKQGIVGSPDTGLEPYAILILFFGTAYLCISLGESGLFRYLARMFAIMGGSKGPVLFNSFFALSSLLTVATSNDIVILNLTPIICSMCLASDLDVKAFALPSFFVSNIFSMVLVVGNPTNVIAASAYGLNFAEYSKWSILPAIAAAATCYGMCYWYFHETITTAVLDPDLAKKMDGKLDKLQAWFGAVNLLLCIVIIIIHEFVHIQLWLAITPFVVIEIIFDICITIRGTHTTSSGSIKGDLLQKQVAAFKHDMQPHEDYRISRTGNNTSIDDFKMSGVVDDYALTDEPASFNNNLNIQDSTGAALRSTESSYLLVSPQFATPQIVRDRARFHNTGVCCFPQGSFVANNFGHTWRRIKMSKPWLVCAQLPWGIAVFAPAMFIMVESFDTVGWVDILANNVFAPLISYNTLASSFIGVFLSATSCSFLNNQPMTAFFSRIIIEADIAGKNLPTCNIIALAVGSNLGANLTLAGALAGLMWRQVLVNQGAQISMSEFAKVGFVVTPLVLAAASAALAFEFWLFPA